MRWNIADNQPLWIYRYGLTIIKFVCVKRQPPPPPHYHHHPPRSCESQASHFVTWSSPGTEPGQSNDAMTAGPQWINQERIHRFLAFISLSFWHRDRPLTIRRSQTSNPGFHSSLLNVVNEAQEVSMTKCMACACSAGVRVLQGVVAWGTMDKFVFVIDHVWLAQWPGKAVYHVQIHKSQTSHFSQTMEVSGSFGEPARSSIRILIYYLTF